MYAKKCKNNKNVRILRLFTSYNIKACTKFIGTAIKNRCSTCIKLGMVKIFRVKEVSTSL